ncbi:MAG: hypothetical protein RLZZ479_1325 [Bacteroidota bacterium]|jgi:hypothetical protein
MENFNLNIGDTIMDSVVTKMNEKSCWLNGKRHSWNSINRLFTNFNDSEIISQKNLDIPIDWANKEEVIKYYNSFKEWSFYISVGCISKGNTKLIEVKDGLVFDKGVFWVPAPSSSHSNYCGKTQVNDGWYMATLMQHNNGWFSVNGKNKSNVFSIKHAVNVSPSINDIKQLKPNSLDLRSGSHLYVSYSQSGRTGLEIHNISMIDFANFFNSRYSSDTYGKKIIIPKSIINHLEYKTDLVERLNKILNEASYTIVDNEDWEGYTFEYLIISEKDSKIFFNEISKELQKL